MSQERGISRVVNVPPAAPGFVGPGHLAAPVVSPENFEMTDPFILLMDDHLDIGDRPVGGPHPHAGFETVTLILDGAIFDRDEGGTLNAGEVQDDRRQRHYSQRRRQDQRKGSPASAVAYLTQEQTLDFPRFSND